MNALTGQVLEAVRGRLEGSTEEAGEEEYVLFQKNLLNCPFHIIA